MIKIKRYFTRIKYLHTAHWIWIVSKAYKSTQKSQEHKINNPINIGKKRVINCFMIHIYGWMDNKHMKMRVSSLLAENTNHSYFLSPFTSFSFFFPPNSLLSTTTSHQAIFFRYRSWLFYLQGFWDNVFSALHFFLSSKLC